MLSRFDNDHLHWGGRSLLSLLIRMLIISSTSIHRNKPRNNFLPDLWASLSSVKLMHKICHHIYLQYNFSKLESKGERKLVLYLDSKIIFFTDELLFSPKEIVGFCLFVFDCFIMLWFSLQFTFLEVQSPRRIFFCIITKPNYYFTKLSNKDILVIFIKPIRKNKNSPNNFPIFIVLLMI